MAESEHQRHGPEYRKGSLTLLGSVAMGAGAMIGSGIFVLIRHPGFL